MGITIHFEGQLNDEVSYEAVLALAKRFCEEHSWLHEPISESNVMLNRVRDEKNWDYEGPTKGIAVLPHENSEPFRLEFDRDLNIQDYTKTQFAPIKVHIEIVELLRKLQPYFKHLNVIDEGEFFDTEDQDILANHLQRCFEMLDEYLIQDEKYYGPVRLGSKRIVDVMSRN
jgi:hypothetical protein